MNNSAFRYDPQGNRTSAFHQVIKSDAIASGFMAGRLAQNNAPASANPLLAVQRLCFEQTPAICICDDARSAQRMFVEATHALSDIAPQMHLVHELMPAYQRSYIIDCLSSAADFAIQCPTVLFTSAACYRQMAGENNSLLESFEVVNADPASPTNYYSSDEPAVSCICLRSSAGGRWILMDHEAAATVCATESPTDYLKDRLLNHTVQVRGHRLAPYLAMMFDVPLAWKNHAELAACALLVFDQDECLTGCSQPGVPTRIIWNDTLGLVWD